MINNDVINTDDVIKIVCLIWNVTLRHWFIFNIYCFFLMNSSLRHVGDSRASTLWYSGYGTRLASLALKFDSCCVLLFFFFKTLPLSWGSGSDSSLRDSKSKCQKKYSSWLCIRESKKTNKFELIMLKYDRAYMSVDSEESINVIMKYNTVTRDSL